MITFHLMFELHYKTTFYDKNTLKKHVTPQNHFATAKFKKLTRKKKIKKNQELSPSLRW